MSLMNPKNITPVRLALWNAVALTIFITLLTLFILDDKVQVIWISVGTFLSSYFLYLSTLRYFIYRKIKLIYKLIFDTKATKKEEYFYERILPHKSIEEVRDEVEDWKNKKNIEIQVLRNNEQFRKEFLMNLAHELRTPIFTTQGYIHTLMDGAINDDKVCMQFLTNAGKGIDRLADLTQDIEKITNLESGKIPIIKEIFNIQDLVKDVYAEMDMMAQKRRIKLQIKQGTNIALHVNADKSKIRQVIENLVTNAIKYGFDDMTITTGFYIVDEHKILVEINDTGPGIREEIIPRLFERFYRGDKSRNRKIGGTGLGLSIVKHIIEAHEQSVTVRSKITVGSTFGFTLERS